jgi:uncharacterized membrane-anchored protein
MKINYGEYICAGLVGYISMAIAHKIESDSLMKYILALAIAFVGLYFIVKINKIQEKK